MHKISSGTKVVDELLEGGYETDAITTIYGPAGSGKTNLCVLAAVYAAKTGKKVIFVDTEGGFSITRLKQLVQDPRKILEKVMFFKPTTFEEQNKAIQKLKEKVDNRIGLIIVDTLTMLYRFERKHGEEIHDFNRELGLQITALTEITRKKNIPVLLTNQVYTDFNGRTHMIGGDILKYGSKCLLELQHFHQNKRKIVLRKHRSLPGEKEAYFEIVQDGISAFAG